MNRAASLVALLLLLPLCSCKVGPNYSRPAATLPDQYPQLAPEISNPNATPAFGEMKWWSVFQDKILEALIREALVNNYDIRIAATRVVQARAALGVTRADQFPQVSGAAGIQQVRSEVYPGGPTFDTLAIQASYILDFWGQYRRATEAARANLTASEFGQEVVRTTLVSDVASAYFSLRRYDEQLEYSQKTLVANQEMLNLNTVKFKGGESPKTDVLQAQILVQQAEAQIITIQQSIAQTENAISILLGRNPGPIDRGISLTEQPHLPEIPSGLPSTLLERRPDVRQSEMFLVSANANVGVAKAAFFPQFSLTGSFGAQSTSILAFLEGPATFWSLAGQLAQPIFEVGAFARITTWLGRSAMRPNSLTNNQYNLLYRMCRTA